MLVKGMYAGISSTGTRDCQFIVSKQVAQTPLYFPLDSLRIRLNLPAGVTCARVRYS